MCLCVQKHRLTLMYYEQNVRLDCRFHHATNAKQDNDTVPCELKIHEKKIKNIQVKRNGFVIGMMSCCAKGLLIVSYLM